MDSDKTLISSQVITNASLLFLLAECISGHKEYFSNLKHAAYSEGKEVLFVNRGVDISRPLSAQNDCFWWGYQNFSLINKPYSTFRRIVRGYQSNEHNDLEHSKKRKKL